MVIAEATDANDVHDRSFGKILERASEWVRRPEDCCKAGHLVVGRWFVGLGRRGRVC